MKRTNKKNLNILRICKTGMIAVALTWSAGVWAQPNPDYVTFQKVGETIDTVTVGSRMAYRVKGDAVIAAMPATIMDPSIFKWLFSETVTIKSLDGTSTLSEVGAGTHYYAEKEISVVMPANPGAMTLTIAEKSRPKVGTGCESPDSVANIRIVPKPKLEWPATKEIGGCSGNNVDIALTLTGYKDWVVTYDVLYTAYTVGATTSTIVSGAKATIGSAQKLTIASSVFGTAPGNPGKYEIRVTNLTDRISRKSLDQDLVKAVAGTDIPAATNMYTIHVYPTPTTHKLEHVKNL